MKYLLQLVVFVFLPQLAIANDAVLDDVSARMKALSQVNGTFIQTKNIAVLPLPLKSSGVFEYDRETGVRWNTLTPVESMLSISADGVKQTEQGKLKTLQGAESFADALLSLFNGNYAALHAQFDISAAQNAEFWTLKLLPKSTALQKELREISVAGNDMPTMISFAYANGDVVVIEMMDAGRSTLNEH